jgi:hypothetical protein
VSAELLAALLVLLVQVGGAVRQGREVPPTLALVTTRPTLAFNLRRTPRISSECVCMCVCVCVYVYVCMYVCMYVGGEGGERECVFMRPFVSWSWDPRYPGFRRCCQGDCGSPCDLAIGTGTVIAWNYAGRTGTEADPRPRPPLPE